MDYGNDSSVDINSIFDSNISVFDWEPLAKECLVDNIMAVGDQWNLEAVAYVQNKICYEELDTEILGKQMTKVLVEIYVENGCLKLSDHLIRMGWAIPRNAPIAPTMPQQLVSPNPVRGMALPGAPVLHQPMASQHSPGFAVVGMPPKPPVFAPVPGMIPQQAPVQPSASYGPMAIKQPVQQQPTIASFRQRILKRRTKEPCVVSYINDLEDFYIHLTSCDTELGELQEQLQAYGASGQHPLSTVFKDLACIALFRDDNLWYRAVIKEVQPLAVKVMYVDYGNEAVVQRSDLLPIPPTYLTKETMAIKCTLYGLPQHGIWSPEEIEVFRQVIEESSGNHLIALVHELIDEAHSVELFTPNRMNINSRLKERLDALDQRRNNIVPPPAQYQQPAFIPQPQQLAADVRGPTRDTITKTTDQRASMPDNATAAASIPSGLLGIVIELQGAT